MQGISFNFDVNGLVEQLKPAVEAVATTLGTSADSLWSIGMQGMIAKGIASAVLASIFALFMVIGFVLIICGFYQRAKKPGSNYEGILAGGWILSGCMAIGVIFSSWYAAMHLYAPQYSLIMEIVGKLNGSSS